MNEKDSTRSFVLDSLGKTSGSSFLLDFWTTTCNSNTTQGNISKWLGRDQNPDLPI